MRFCKYLSGEVLQSPKEEKELVIDKVAWIPKAEIKNLQIVSDEKPGVDYFLGWNTLSL